MGDLLIQDVRVLAGDPARGYHAEPHQDLVIRGSRIAAVAPHDPVRAAGASEVIPGGGLLAMPGLINTHAHVPMVIFRGLAEDVALERWFNEFMWPLESNLEEEDVYWGMLLGLAELIEGGVTCVADHYFFMDRAAEAVSQAGTRAALGWAMFGNQGPAALDRTAAFVRRWQGAAGGRITTWMAPHAPYTCDDDFLRAAGARAHELGVGIHIHVSETARQVQASLEKRGCTPIRLLHDLGVLQSRAILAHAIGATEDDIRLMADHPCGVAHAPKTYLKLAMGTAPVTAFRRAGVPVGLATDGAVSNNTLDLWESLRLMAMTQKQAAGTPEVMTLDEALAVATRDSARVLGMEDCLGAMAPGCLADVILVALDNVRQQPLHNLAATLVYATGACDVRTVIVDGRVIMRDRKLLTMDKGEVVERVNRSLARLSRRVPAHRIQLYQP